MKKPASGPAGFDLFSLRGVIAVTLAYGLIHALIRLTAGTNLALDDAKENIFTQKLSWGYLPDNPPLFEWTLTLVQQITGPNLYSFLIIKYLLMAWTAAFLFLAGRRLFNDARWAAITVFSATLLYQIGYNYHQAFTHSLMVIAMVAFSFWAFVRLLQERTLAAYLLFGLSVGLGLLSKYNFLGFLASVLLPALYFAETRKALLDVRIILSVMIAGLIILPHGLFVLGNQELMLKYVSGKLGQNNGAYFERVGEGLGNLLVASVSFYLPFLLVAFALYREAFQRRKAVSIMAKAPLMRIAGLSSLAGFALLLLAVFVFGASNITERYVVPLFLPGFLAVMEVLRRTNLDRDRSQRWLVSVAAVALVLMLVRFIGVFSAGPPVCDKCQRWIPYDDIRTELRAAGLDETAIYVSNEENTAGNLRRLMPGAMVRSVNLLFYNPVPEGLAKPCYFVWSEELLGQPVNKRFEDIATSSDKITVYGKWKHPFREAGWRITEWGVSPIPQDHRYYDTLCAPRRNG